VYADPVTAWILVWLIVALTTTVLFAAAVIALVRHGMFLGRAAARLAEETGVLTAAIAEESSRASGRVASLSLKDRGATRR
jgi:hypothetical protein